MNILLSYRHSFYTVIRLGLILFLFIGHSANVKAQEDLSLQEAISIGLKNNYDILIADYNEVIARNNNHPGTAGLLPRLDFSMSGSAFKSESPASFLVSRLNSGAGLSLSWTLFDGFRALATKDRLALLEQQSVGNSAIIVETTIEAIILAYNNALVAQEQGKVLSEVLLSSRRRLTFEEYRKEIGASGTFEILQFRDAVLTDSANLITQQLNIRNASRNLNLLMNVPIDSEWNFTDALRKGFSDYQLEQLEAQMLEDNNIIRNQYVFNKILKEDTRIARANLYPTLGLTGNSNFTSGQTTRIDGQTLNFNAFDYSAGLSLNFNLFNGGNTRRQIENARINERIGDLQEKQLEDALSNELKVNFDNYEARKLILAIQEARSENATTNLEIAEDRFKNGLISSLDFRTIQLQYRNAQFNLLSALRDIKESETALVRITGGLVREK